jgi:hypothetical protein
MGDYTLNNLGSTSNANNVTDNDRGLVDSMLGNLTGGGGGSDNVSEYSSTFVVTSYIKNAYLLELNGVVDGRANLWTWKVPYDYSVVEFSVISNERTAVDGSKYWTLTLQTAQDRAWGGGSGVLSYGSATVINGTNKAIYNTVGLPTNIDVSSRPYIRVKAVASGLPVVDLQIALKFKMAHVG